MQGTNYGIDSQNYDAGVGRTTPQRFCCFQNRIIVDARDDAVPLIR